MSKILANFTDTGSETFFRCQVFPMSVPRLCPVPILPQKNVKKSRYREFSVPERHTLAHLHPLSSTSIHFCPSASTCIHLHPLLSTCVHLGQPAFTCVHQRPSASTCIHMRISAPTFIHLQSRALALALKFWQCFANI